MCVSAVPQAAYDHVVEFSIYVARGARSRTNGIYYEHGMLYGKWVDVILKEKMLG